MKIIANTMILALAILMVHADPKTDIDIVLSRINQMPAKSETRLVLEEIVKEPQPRIYELMRRVEIESYSNSLGILDSTIGKTNKDFLYPQIDGLLLNKEVKYPDGIIAARVINFVRKSATRIVFWKRSEGTQEMTKTVWRRKYPSGIDPRMPLDDWFSPESSRLKSTEECKLLVPFFDDPMPPSTLYVAAHQFTGERTYIIEMVISLNGKLKYNWSVRSPFYGGLIETIAFEKIWDVIGELPTEGREDSDDMHKNQNKNR